MLWRLWPYAVVVVAVLGLLFGMYRAGYNAAWREADIESLNAQIAIMREDVKIAAEAKAQAEKQTIEMEAANVENEQSLQALRALLAEQGGDDPIPPDRLERLLDIR
jgi:hypothetical protein